MNTIRRFLFKDLNIRGQHLSIDQVWQSLIKDRGYTAQVKQLFGELSALAIMLANGLKHKGKLTIQYQGAHPELLTHRRRRKLHPQPKTKVCQ